MPVTAFRYQTLCMALFPDMLTAQEPAVSRRLLCVTRA